MTNTRDKRIAIIAAEFNQKLMEAMIEAATREVEESGATLVRTLRVAGCYETPLIADLQLAEEGIDALVVLGYIERGETLHGEVMGHVVHGALVKLELKYRKPVGLGIIGPGATPEQAELRKADYARAAVRAALRNLELMREKFLKRTGEATTNG
jgi:6,7-dimethyl-8-ribityllumazine synthase